MRDGRSFLVWEDALRLVRQPDLDESAEIFVPAGFVDLPFPLPGMPVRSGRGVRSVLAPVWQVRPKEGGPGLAKRDPIVLPSTPHPELVVLAFDLRGVEPSGSSYRLAYVHVAATRTGGLAVLGDGVDPKATRHRAKTVDDEGNMSLVRRYFEMRSAGARQRIGALVAPDCVDHAHPDSVGAEGVVRDATRFWTANPGASVTLDTLVAEGELVAARTTVRRGADGEVLVESGMEFFRVRDGKIAEQWSCYPRESEAPAPASLEPDVRVLAREALRGRSGS
jgi:predicted SnoaL-like aldol condensation-catalyzing enzyme